MLTGNSHFPHSKRELPFGKYCIPRRNFQFLHEKSRQTREWINHSEALSGKAYRGLRDRPLVVQSVKYEVVSVTSYRVPMYKALESSQSFCFLLTTMGQSTPQCIFGMNKLSNKDLITTASRIQDQLLLPEFNTIQPTPAEVKLLINTFIDENNECDRKNYSRISYRNELRAKLLHLLRLQLFGVNSLAASQPELLCKSGFKMRKDRTSPDYPSQAVIKSIKPWVEPGSIVVRVKAQRNIKFYEVVVSSQNGQMIKMVHSSKTSVRVEGLTPGSVIDVAARAFSSLGAGPYSNGLVYPVPMVVENPIHPTSRIIHPDELAS